MWWRSRIPKADLAKRYDNFFATARFAHHGGPQLTASPSLMHTQLSAQLRWKSTSLSRMALKLRLLIDNTTQCNAEIVVVFGKILKSEGRAAKMLRKQCIITLSHFSNQIWEVTTVVRPNGAF